MDATDAANADPCPKCGLAAARRHATCPRCGVIFARIHDVPDVEEQRVPHIRPLSRPVETVEPAISGYEIKILCGGFVAALVFHWITPLSMLLSILVTLLHETGHAAFGWLLGCPSVPAFDFVYGGGITYHENFQPAVAVFIAAGWATLAWFFRRNTRGTVIVALVALFWLIVVTSEWRREIVIASMGHGGELVLAGAFLWMALTGRGLRSPELERPPAAFVGFFVVIHSIKFSSQLRSDESFLAWYLDGKGGALMNDLEVVALDLKILTGAEIDVVMAAGWLMTASFLVPLLVIAAYLLRRPLTNLALRTFGTPVA